MRWLLGLVLCGVAVVAGGRAAVAAEGELPLLYQEDFENGGLEKWTTTDPDPAESVWKIIEAGKPGNHALRVTGISKFVPPFRSPWSFALVKDTIVSDFELSAKVQETNTSAGGHRDLCFFWGYQDPAHFYYVHLGAKADPHACQIFVVDNAPRKAITVDTAEGTPWKEGWHQVKVVRNVVDGSMKVYFDDMTKPLMTANDKRFTWGQVGIGTFDDHGNFDDVTLRGIKVEKPKDWKPNIAKPTEEQAKAARAK